MKTMMAAAIALAAGLAGSPAMACPTVRGTIGTQTTASFQQLMQSEPFTCLLLNSRGGSVLEAETIAGIIRANHMVVEVPDGGMCASACFLLFAAGGQRWIGGTNVRIGVHGAGTPEGQENGTSYAIDTLMGRDLAQYGVPDEIIGKMVRTPNSDIAWLTVSELMGMDVRIATGPQTTTPTAAPITGDGVEAGPAATAAPTPTPVPAMPDAGTQAFADGERDRRTLESWVSTLSGDYKDGALYWAEHRSDAEHHLPAARCDAAPMLSSASYNAGDWWKGCTAAQARLAPLDARRHKEPAYKAGWNAASAQLAGG